jgi:uncharacterized YccA/Bax inhibitor family protein
MATPLRSGNPTLSRDIFLDSASGSVVGTRDGAMTINGTVNKTAFLLILAMVGAMVSWSRFDVDGGGAMTPYVVGGMLGGLVFGMITIFKKEWAGFTAPAYALLEGLFLGAVSAIFNARYHGIVIEAVGLTFGTLGALLIAYRTGLIRATEKFKLGVVAATGGIAIFYLIGMVMNMFGHPIQAMYSGTPLGIGLSVVVLIVAALNLILDFDMIEQGVAMRAPKYMEWYGAFGLVVTLVWLYLEFLRLLMKLNSRN